MEWRFLDTGRARGALNMAIDEAIATLHGQGKSPPTVRFYGWDPACLTVGYFQSVEREVDVEGCTGAGVDLVRRPTGGRAVLHDDELTYSLIATEKDPLVSGGVTESYRKISAGILAGLEELSIEAEMAPAKRGRDRSQSAACFDSASTYEVTVGGKKLVGSAQVRRGGVILQHGSLLLEFEAGRLLNLLKLKSDERLALEAELEAKVTSLAAVAKIRVEYDELAGLLKKGFEQALGVHLGPGVLSDDEKSLAWRLVTEKYTSREWTFRK